MDPVAGWGTVAWICDGSDPGALDPAWGNVCCIPRARALWGGDAAWLAGIRDSSNLGSQVPTWAFYHF